MRASPDAAPVARDPETEVLVVTPNPGDAQISREVLNERGIATRHCHSLLELAAVPGDEVGCIMLVEEALVQPELADLQQAIQMQPPWSDVPIILVASEGTPL